MNAAKLHLVAQSNLDALQLNPYPGRGIVIGRSEDGKSMLHVYWIMGRSENSRNRIFVANGPMLFTEPADPAKVKDPNLIIYQAMGQGLWGGTHELPIHITSNGTQTGGTLTAIQKDTGSGSVHASFTDALNGWMYEPDEPNFTPRITGISTARGEVGLSIIKRDPWGGTTCVRENTFYGSVPEGYGHFISTYSGDGNPLPPFEGSPMILCLGGSAQQILEHFFDILHGENFVSLAVKRISLGNPCDVGIRVLNKYSKVD